MHNFCLAGLMLIAAVGDKPPQDGVREIVALLAAGTGVVFISAHPDDEIYASALLGFAADHGGKAKVVCATGGQSGGYFLPEPSTRTLREVRTNELEKACAIINAIPVVLPCKNGLSTAHPEGLAIPESGEEAIARWEKSGEGRQTPAEVVARWKKEYPGLLDRIREEIAAAAPSVVLTFEPSWGITGHNEHRAVALVVEEVYRTAPAGFREDHPLYYVVHPDRARTGDLRIPADLLQALPGARDYPEMATRAFAVHESQFGPMGSPGNTNICKDFRHYAETVILRPGPAAAE